VTSSGPTILACGADARLSALLESRLARQAPNAAETKLTILLATKTLAESAEEALIGQALEAWSSGQLLVVSVDAATPPLGLRDVERIPWTPGTDDASQLAVIAERLSRQAETLRRAKGSEDKGGEDKGGGANMAAAPAPAAPAQGSASPLGAKPSRRRGLAIAALVVCVGLAGLLATFPFMRSPAPLPTASPDGSRSAAPELAPQSPLPAGAPRAPEAMPVPVPAPAPVRPRAAPPPGRPPAPESPSPAAPFLPDLDKPSGGGGSPASSPADPPATGAGTGAGAGAEPATSLLAWVGVGLWLVPVLLGLGLIAYLAARRRTLGKTTAARPPAPPLAAARPTPARPTPAGADAGKPIFISYSHQDIARVDPIVAEIEKLGHAVWIDRRELSGGPGWAGQIVRGLRAARTVVLMASRQAYASDQVVREMYLAMSEKKNIVPLELEAAEIPDELQYILAPFQRHRLDGGDRAKIIGNALAAL
jgi:TIR domain